MRYDPAPRGIKFRRQTATCLDNALHLCICYGGNAASPKTMLNAEKMEDERIPGHESRFRRIIAISDF
jgi:hypothetical protein